MSKRKQKDNTTITQFPKTKKLNKKETNNSIKWSETNSKIKETKDILSIKKNLLKIIFLLNLYQNR